MKITGLALLLASLAFSARADIRPQTITGDLDGDGIADRVEIQPRPDDPSTADVAFTLSATRQTINAYQLVQAENVASATIGKGEFYLELTTLSGRSKYHWEFQIGLQGGALVVRRYRLGTADGLASAGPDKTHYCEVDFVARTAVRDDRPAPPPGPPVRVEDWAGAKSPAACDF